VIFLAPQSYSVFIYTKFRIDAGVLFPVLLVSWTAALFGFLLNNIFIDRTITDKKIQMSSFMKGLPSVLGIPSFFSFVWFIFRWYKGDPHR